MDKLDSKIIQFVVKKNKLAEPLDVKRFSSGVINRVYDIDNKYALKIEGKGEHEILKVLPSVTEKLLAKDAKVPKILDFDNVDGTRYVLMEKVKGHNLVYDWMTFSDKQKENIIEQLAEQLQIWHSISSNEYSMPIVSFTSFKNLQPAVERL